MNYRMLNILLIPNECWKYCSCKRFITKVYTEKKVTQFDYLDESRSIVTRNTNVSLISSMNCNPCWVQLILARRLLGSIRKKNGSITLRQLLTYPR